MPGQPTITSGREPPSDQMQRQERAGNCTEDLKRCGYARLAGPALSPGGDLGRGRRQLRPLLRARHQGRAVPVRLGRRRRRSRTASRCRSTPTRSGTATCPTSCRASSTATASTGRTSRRKGHRFNPNKVVLDPYAKAIGRDLHWDDALFGYKSATRQDDLSFDDRDSAAFAPLASVIDTAFTWGDDRPPRTPWHKTLIYELHVKGFTMLHPERAREAARHLRRPGLGGGHPAPARAWASPRSSCCRSTTTSTTATWSRRG